MRYDQVVGLIEGDGQHREEEEHDAERHDVPGVTEPYILRRGSVISQHGAECPYIGCDEHENGSAAHGHSQIDDVALGESGDEQQHDAKQRLCRGVERRRQRGFLQGVQQCPVQAKYEQYAEIGEGYKHGVQQLASRYVADVQYAVPVDEERGRHGRRPYRHHDDGDYGVGSAYQAARPDRLVVLYGFDKLVAQAVAYAYVEEADPCH